MNMSQRENPIKLETYDDQAKLKKTFIIIMKAHVDHGLILSSIGVNMWRTYDVNEVYMNLLINFEFYEVNMWWKYDFSHSHSHSQFWF